MFCGTAGALLPFKEEFAVTRGEAGFGIDVEFGDGSVDPIGRTFQFDVVADRRLVYDEVSVRGFVGPLGTEFFVDEGWSVAELPEDFGEGFAIGNSGFGFDADFVAGFAGGLIGHAFVSHGADAAVLADAENLSGGAQIVVGSVEESVVLEGAGSLKLETELGKARLEGCGIGEGKL